MFASRLRFSTSRIFSLHLSKPVFDFWNYTAWPHPTCPRFMFLCVVINQSITTWKSKSPTSVGRHQIIFSLCCFETLAWPAPTGMSLFGKTTQFWSTNELSSVHFNRRFAGQWIFSNCNQLTSGPPRLCPTQMPLWSHRWQIWPTSALLPLQRWSFATTLRFEWHRQTCFVIYWLQCSSWTRWRWPWRW